MCAIKSAVLALLLAGCSSSAASMNPVDWWHSLEGGEIAAQRPPPPNADAPYPNLSTVPARPVLTDAATRGRIASGLVTDRANAQYAGAAMPDLYLPHAPPPAPGHGTAPLPPSDTPSASLLAATAGAPPRTAQADRVESAPLAPLQAAAPPAGPGAPEPGAKATVTMDAAAATMPAIPPRAPRIQGIDVPATTAPTRPPIAPPAPPPAPKAIVTATLVLVPFQPGAAEITADAQNDLHTLVLKRGAAAMRVLGYGDAARGNPAAQSAALPLALARARAIAAVLIASGVPASLVQVRAEAEGRGGAAQILDHGGAAQILDHGGAAQIAEHGGAPRAAN